MNPYQSSFVVESGHEYKRDSDTGQMVRTENIAGVLRNAVHNVKASPSSFTVDGCEVSIHARDGKRDEGPFRIDESSPSDPATLHHVGMMLRAHSLRAKAEQASQAADEMAAMATEATSAHVWQVANDARAERDNARGEAIRAWRDRGAALKLARPGNAELCEELLGEEPEPWRDLWAQWMLNVNRILNTGQRKQSSTDVLLIRDLPEVPWAELFSKGTTAQHAAQYAQSSIRSRRASVPNH